MFYIVSFIISFCLILKFPEMDKTNIILGLFFADKVGKIVKNIYTEIEKMGKKEEASSGKEASKKDKKAFSKIILTEIITWIAIIKTAITMLISIAIIIIVLIYIIRYLW